MSGRPSDEVMERRRIANDPVLRAALVEKARLENELYRVETFISIYEELHAPAAAAHTMEGVG